MHNPLGRQGKTEGHESHHSQSVSQADAQSRKAEERMSYQVHTPGVRTYLDGRECTDNSTAGKREYKLRTEAMRQRQDFQCAIGGEWLAPNCGQFDHEAGRGSGGGHRDDRIEIDGEWVNAAVCGACNGAKGSRRYSWQGNLYLPVK